MPEKSLQALADFYFGDKTTLVLHEPQGRFAHPFLTPGGGYTQSVWDWDSYFLGLGLIAENEEFKRYLIGTARVFIDFREPDGYVAAVQSVGRAEHPLTAFHRQGLPVSSIKPILAQMLVLANGDQPFADRERFEGLKEILRHWEIHQKHRSGLYTVRSHRTLGPDNDPCVYGRPENSTAPVITNVLMYREFRAMAKLADDLGLGEADTWREKATAMRECINDLMWDAEDAWYYSQDVGYQTPHIGFPVLQSTEEWAMPMRLRCGTAVMALWAGVPDAAQAKSMIERYFSGESSMRAAHGVRSLCASSRFYNTVDTGQPLGKQEPAPGSLRFIGAGADEQAAGPANWQGPVWLVLNYCLFSGLMRYGYRKEAERLFHDSVELLAKDLKKTGTTHEYYHPDSGDGMGASNFMCWNLTVFAMRRWLNEDRSLESL